MLKPKPSKQKKKSVASILREGAAKIESEREGSVSAWGVRKSKGSFPEEAQGQDGVFSPGGLWRVDEVQ